MANKIEELKSRIPTGEQSLEDSITNLERENADIFSAWAADQIAWYGEAGYRLPDHSELLNLLPVACGDDERSYSLRIDAPSFEKFVATMYHTFGFRDLTNREDVFKHLADSRFTHMGFGLQLVGEEGKVIKSVLSISPRGGMDTAKQLRISLPEVYEINSQLAAGK